MYSPSRGPLLPAGALRGQSTPQRMGSFVPPVSTHAQSPANVGSHASFGMSPSGAPILIPSTMTARALATNAVQMPVTAPSAHTMQRVSHGIAHHRGPLAVRGDCQDQQCVEEECDPEECGDEKRGPKDDNRVCGIDRRPLLPLLLCTSTIVGAAHMMLLQFNLLSEAIPFAKVIKAFFLALYVVTLGCMAWCALCNPGELSASPEAADGDEVPLPSRAHKTWQYNKPIRRYDHYCRWLTNCIGLLNHREFVTMVGGLVTIGVCGCLVDVGLIFYLAQQGAGWLSSFLLAMHIAYSAMLTFLAGPIFRLHVGFIIRNELANEWKRNDFYVVTGRSGKKVSVNELSDDEFNERFESFEYDKSKNRFDQSGPANCFAFWCTTRWDSRQLGEF